MLLGFGDRFEPYKTHTYIKTSHGVPSMCTSFIHHLQIIEKDHIAYQIVIIVMKRTVAVKKESRCGAVFMGVLARQVNKMAFECRDLRYVQGATRLTPEAGVWQQG